MKKHPPVLGVRLGGRLDGSTLHWQGLFHGEFAKREKILFGCAGALNFGTCQAGLVWG